MCKATENLKSRITNLIAAETAAILDPKQQNCLARRVWNATDLYICCDDDRRVFARDLKIALRRAKLGRRNVKKKLREGILALVEDFQNKEMDEADGEDLILVVDESLPDEA